MHMFRVTIDSRNPGVVMIQEFQGEVLMIRDTYMTEGRIEKLSSCSTSETCWRLDPVIKRSPEKAPRSGASKLRCENRPKDTRSIGQSHKPSRAACFDGRGGRGGAGTAEAKKNVITGRVGVTIAGWRDDFFINSHRRLARATCRNRAGKCSQLKGIDR